MQFIDSVNCTFALKERPRSRFLNMMNSTYQATVRTGFTQATTVFKNFSTDLDYHE